MKNALGNLMKVIVGLIVVYLFFVPIYIHNYSKSYTYKHPTEIAYYDYAIVLGAGVDRHGNPQDMLADRLDVAAELYLKNKVNQILLTGDNGAQNNHETDAMTEYMVNEKMIPKEAIVTDPMGKRTYDSCARISEDVTIQSAVIITQDFHLDRAIFLCNQLGVPMYGLQADDHDSYNHLGYFKLREFFAVHKAFIDIYLYTPDYVELGDDVESLSAE